MTNCASIGCTSEATELISYNYRGEIERQADRVCTPCADSYSRRPVLANFARCFAVPIPDTRFYREMASGHFNRTGHALAGHLESAAGGIWTLVRECCGDTTSTRTDPFAGIPGAHGELDVKF